MEAINHSTTFFQCGSRRQSLHFFSLFSKVSISSVSATSEEMQDELTVKEASGWCRNDELNLTLHFISGESTLW